MIIPPQKNVKSKKEIYYEIILDRIIRCEYSSNEIITEKALTNEFDVSKSPIREALLELCNKGYLQNIPRFGYQVTSFDKNTIKEINEFRICLERASLDKFWDRINLEKVKAIREQFKDSFGEQKRKRPSAEYWEINTQFHVALISLVKCSYMKSRLYDAMKYLGVAYAQAYWINYHKEIITSESCLHEKILNAILENDKENALLYIEQDINNFNKIEKQDI